MTGTLTHPPGARLAAALAAFQAELPRIAKGAHADAGTYGYDYADLEDVHSKAMPILGKHGLAFLARPTVLDDGRFVLAYSLMHASGEREDGVYPLPDKGAPQQIGSAITYARRYTFCAVTGIAPGGEDDDGAAAQSATAAPRKRQQRRQDQPEPPSPNGPMSTVPGTITDAQKKKLGATFTGMGFGRDEREQRLAAASGIVERELSSANDLSKAEASKLIDTLDRCKTRDRLVVLLATGELAPDEPDPAPLPGATQTIPQGHPAPAGHEDGADA